MIKVESLLLGAYAALPVCQYILIGQNLNAGAVDLSTLYDEYGNFIGHNDTVKTTVKGILTERTEETTQTSEGVTVVSSLKLTSTVNIKMPGFDDVDDRIQWLLQDRNNRQYRLGNKRKYGKLFTYTGQYSIHENH